MGQKGRRYSLRVLPMVSDSIDPCLLRSGGIEIPATRRCGIRHVEQMQGLTEARQARHPSSTLMPARHLPHPVPAVIELTMIAPGYKTTHRLSRG